VGIVDRHAVALDNRYVHAVLRCVLAVALAGLVVPVALAGCKKGGGPASCDAVGARFLAIAEADLAKATDIERDERDAVRGLIAPLRDAMVKACRQDGWSVDARTCYVGAPDEARFRACEAKLTGEQRTLLEQSAARGVQPK
jgi:hypothetical protein